MIWFYSEEAGQYLPTNSAWTYTVSNTSHPPLSTTDDRAPEPERRRVGRYTRRVARRRINRIARRLLRD